VIATAVTVASASPVAFADARGPSPADLARAEELYDNGRTLFAEGSYAAAATAFEQAHSLSGNLDMLYNAALAHDRAGNFETAIELLDRYRALAPASERAQLDERKRSLQVRLDKQREAAADAAATGAPEADPSTSPSDATPLPPQVDSARERRVRPRTWALLGATAVGLAVGTGLGAASLVRSRRAKNGCTEVTGDLLCEDRVADPARSSRPLAIGADVSFAIAGALGATFIALLVLDLRRSRDSAQRVAVLPSADGLAISF
jgi:tetratricopeptide (TPR) repeat protein